MMNRYDDFRPYEGPVRKRPDEVHRPWWSIKTYERHEGFCGAPNTLIVRNWEGKVVKMKHGYLV